MATCILMEGSTRCHPQAEAYQLPKATGRLDIGKCTIDGENGLVKFVARLQSCFKRCSAEASCHHRGIEVHTNMPPFLLCVPFEVLCERC